MIRDNPSGWEIVGLVLFFAAPCVGLYLFFVHPLVLASLLEKLFFLIPH
jgi:hypothetical protein